MNTIGNFITPIHTGLSDVQREQALYVSSIIRDVFGINSLVYFPSTEKISTQASLYYGIELINEQHTEQMSCLGTPVVGVFKFAAGAYNAYDKTGRVVTKQMGDFVFPYSCIVEFSRASVITQTKTLGCTGSVKEIYGLDDWKINIRGIAFNDAANPAAPTAHEIIAELVSWRHICDSIQIEGALFGGKDIYNIVIEELNIQPIEGKYNVIPFQIQAVSDEPIELTI